MAKLLMHWMAVAGFFTLFALVAIGAGCIWVWERIATAWLGIRIMWLSRRIDWLEQAEDSEWRTLYDEPGNSDARWVQQRSIELHGKKLELIRKLGELES